jgi:hypothetical protein
MQNSERSIQPLLTGVSVELRVLLVKVAVNKRTLLVDIISGDERSGRGIDGSEDDVLEVGR